MIRSRVRTLGVVAVSLALLFTAACSDDDGGDDASTDTEATDTTAAEDGGDTGDASDTTAGDTEDSTAGDEGETGQSIAVADTDLGTILVDGQGVTLYLFTADTQGEPGTCTDACAASWPEFTGPVTAGDGIDESLLGTVPSAVGTEQVTYNGWPLYYFAQDVAPGDANGQGSGGVWWVVDAEGNAIES